MAAVGVEAAVVADPPLVAMLFHNGPMTISAASPADTWGISGPAFLFLYVAAAGLLILAAVVQRAIVFAGRRDLAANQLTPEQAAYLNGGERLAVYASLGKLRAAGSVGTSAQGRTLVTTGPLPAGATRLDHAVHNAAGQRIRPRDLATHQWVRAALHDIRRQLEHVGLAPTANSAGPPACSRCCCSACWPSVWPGSSPGSSGTSRCCSCSCCSSRWR